MSIEVLARLNARIIDPAGAGSGGIGQLTAEDVAASLLGASEIECWVARLLFAGQDECRYRIWQWLITVAIKMAQEQKWRKDTFEQKELIAAFALNEVAPDRRCPVCHGRLVTPDAHGVMVDCDCCAARGWIKLGSGRKAELLGVDVRNYRETWRDRENALVGRLREAEESVVRRVTRRLG